MDMNNTREEKITKRDAMVTYCQAGRLARVSLVAIYPDVLLADL